MPAAAREPNTPRCTWMLWITDTCKSLNALESARMQQHDGLWWTPTAPDHKVLGRLTIQNDGSPDLDVACHLIDAPEGSLAAILRPLGRPSTAGSDLVVLGQSHAGTRFTLYDGHVAKSSFGMTPMATATLSFDRGLKGDCVEDPTSLPITRAYMRYPGMDAWLGARPFEVTHDEGRKHVSITHTMPAIKRFRIDAERQLLVAWTRRGPTQSSVQTCITMTSRPWLGIEYANAVAPDRAREDAHCVGELLSMLLGAPTATRCVELQSPQCTMDIGGETSPLSLRVLAGRFALPRSLRGLTKSDLLLSFSDLDGQFEAVLQRWFTLRVKCWGAVVPYLAAQRTPSPFAEQRFFDFASAAESLHAHLRPDDRRFPDEEARALRQSALQNIPTERRGDFDSALRRVNALTYRDRVEHLLSRFPAIAQAAIGDPTAQKSFCKQVRDLRNVQAHGLSPTDVANPSGLRLVRLASKLKPVLDAWILAEIGITAEAIEKAMRGCRTYWFYASCESWPWDVA